MTHPTPDTIWLTRAAHDRLETELAELSRAPAPSPAVEGRIRELLAVLSRSEVGDKPDDGLVEAGMTVTVLFEGDRNATTFLLAHRGVTDSDVRRDIDVYSPQSPLGAAITNKHPGDIFRYETPTGARVNGTVVSATPFREETPAT
jgi:transcription elongation factor GreA